MVRQFGAIEQEPPHADIAVGSTHGPFPCTPFSPPQNTVFESVEKFDMLSPESKRHINYLEYSEFQYVMKLTESIF